MSGWIARLIPETNLSADGYQKKEILRERKAVEKNPVSQRTVKYKVVKHKVGRSMQ